MGESRGDQLAVGILHAVEFRQMQQEMRKPLRDRARPQHLRQGRIAFALEAEAFDQADREIGDFGDEPAQFPAGKLHDGAVTGCDARPLVSAGIEHFRSADEIEGCQ